MTRSDAVALARCVHTRSRRQEPRHLVGAVPTALCQTRCSGRCKAELHELSLGLTARSGEKFEQRRLGCIWSTRL